MLAVDTNVLVRLLVRDDEKQFKAARSLMEDDIYLPDSVVLETEWVLRDIYDFPKTRILEAFRGFFGLKNVFLDDPLKMARVLEWHESGLDFADALHLAKSEHVSEFKTFDGTFIKRAKGLSECKVSSP